MQNDNPYDAPQTIGTPSPVSTVSKVELLKDRILFKNRCGVILIYSLALGIAGTGLLGFLLIFPIVLFVVSFVHVVWCWLLFKLAIYPSLIPRWLFRGAAFILICAPLFALWQLSQSIDDGWHGFWLCVNACYYVALLCTLSAFISIARQEKRRWLETLNWFGLLLGVIATNQVIRAVPISIPWIAGGALNEAHVMIAISGLIYLTNLYYWASQPVETSS